ncbi:MAG: zeta toxin family protein [Holosporales bacterium]|jgi:hypothetical protein|nr:zeta toxin family protein [Holosporales bacterium]
MDPHRAYLYSVTLARSLAIASVYDTFAESWEDSNFNIYDHSFDRITDKAFKAFVNEINILPANMAKEPHIVRLIGQSGSGKTTQLYEAVKNNIAFGFVHLSVGKCAKFHPKYNEIREEFGREMLREKTNGFALLLLFRLLEKLIEEKYNILLELAFLEPEFESYFSKLAIEKYHLLYNVMAVPKALSDSFISKRQKEQGRIVTQESADYFFDVFPRAMSVYKPMWDGADDGKTTFLLWNAYKREPIMAAACCDERFIKLLSEEQNKKIEDIPLVDEEELRRAKTEYFNKLTYFNESYDREKFANIITSRLLCDFPKFIYDDGVELTQIQTGWTNFVFRVVNGSKANIHASKDYGLSEGTNAYDSSASGPQSSGAPVYIARFPRGACFARAMKTDVAATHYVKSVTDIPVADIQIYFEGFRPFSMHVEIPGRALSSFKLNELTSNQIDELARQIAGFFAKIHALNTPSPLQRRLSTFLREVLDEVPSYTDYSDIDLLEQFETDFPILAVHGDLNIGNIIVDDDFNIVGFLDFAFFGVSIPEADLARITCRIDDAFFAKIVSYYEEVSSRKLDRERLSQMTKMWKGIELHYIKYMRQTMPDVVVPDVVG